MTDTQLPEVGIKETTSTGSWLEQKQVQAALEARKALVAVERIDKVYVAFICFNIIIFMIFNIDY